MFVRVQNSKVVEVFPFSSLEGNLHPDLLNQCYSVDENLKIGQFVTVEDIFADVQVPIVNEQGEPVLDFEGNPTFNTVNQRVGQRAWAAEHSPSEIDTELLLAELRAERNRRISLTDWTQLSDSPLSSEQVQAYAVYRQALRDLPENVTDITNVEWPVEPN